MDVEHNGQTTRATGTAFVIYTPETGTEPYTPYLMKPSNPGIFNENYRAELVPLHGAFTHQNTLDETDPHSTAIHINTDSLSSMQAVKSAIVTPHQNERKLHHDIIGNL